MHELFLHVLALLSATHAPSPHASDLLGSLTPSAHASSSPAGYEKPSTGNSDSGSTVKVAVVTAIGVVLAAGVTAFASTFQRQRSSSPTTPVPSTNDTITQSYIADLRNDQIELRKIRTRYNYLREGCVEHGLDPDSLIHAQELRDAGGTP